MDKGIYVILTDTIKITPQRVFAELGHLEATKALIEKSTAIN
jgi:hypothetical protein